MGAFNRWVKGTELAAWRNRRVAEIGARLMQGTAALLDERFRAMAR
jgi:trans-AT polyketide synthase/acyltransferase/oxidoreductase domain-containing protein